MGRVLLAALAAVVALPAFSGRAAATGTVQVQQRDGSKKTYANVKIRIRDEAMSLTSADGRGMLVFGKAACTKVGELVECLPYDATLFQNGENFHIRLQSGTVWFNPSSASQRLSNSSAQLPPRGVELAVKTLRGTYVTLTGIVDEVQK